MQLSKIGTKANACWQDIPNHFQFVSLDAFIVMPIHLHGIIIIDKPGYGVEIGHALSLQHPRFRNQGKTPCPP